MLELSTQTEQTMSSLEIAKLTEKQHFNVLIDIRKVLEEVGIGALKFQGSYLSEQNKELPCYNLPRRECDLVISGYSAKYRLAIIDRWHELEKGNKPKLPNFNSPADAARAWAVEYEEKQLALTKLEAKTAQLDESMEWYSIKRVAANNNKRWQEYSYHDLKRRSIVIGKPPKKIFDANYGEVNTYHVDAWMEVYPADMYVFA
jgi:phage regulator Rha-like protein